jgi:hypothetical protein
LKRGAEELVNTNEWLRLCADLANGSKRLLFEKSRRTPGMAHLDKTEWTVELGRGSDFTLLETFDVPVVRGGQGEQLATTVAIRCVAAWNAFLGERRLLGP